MRLISIVLAALQLGAAFSLAIKWVFLADLVPPMDLLIAVSIVGLVFGLWWWWWHSHEKNEAIACLIAVLVGLVLGVR